jgi:undecaprenyl-diphosphatase
MWTWFPIYLLLLFLIHKKYGLRSFFIALACVSLVLFLTDFTAVHLVKNTVMRLRPSHQPELMNQLHYVTDENGNPYIGGLYGFFSNHASNYFGIATFFYLIMKPIKKKYAFLLFLWVSFIAYSRVYLGVHYPGDVLAGAIYGIAIGFSVSRLFDFLLKKQILTA